MIERVVQIAEAMLRNAPPLLNGLNLETVSLPPHPTLKLMMILSGAGRFSLGFITFVFMTTWSWWRW